MGYTHYFRYKNPILEMNHANDKRKSFFTSEREKRDGSNIWDKLETFSKQFPTHEQSVKKIAAHIEAFKLAANDINLLLKNLPKTSATAGGYHSNDPIVICGGGGTGKPKVDEFGVWLNGTDKGDMSHETFALELLAPQPVYGGRGEYDPKEGVFNFCKTARKPYDFVVCVSLLIYKHYLKGDLKLSSDGDFDDWKPAIDFYESFFKRKVLASTLNEMFGKEWKPVVEKPAKKTAKKKEPAYKDLIGK